MVSFTCHQCQDVVKKPKVLGHASQCGGNNALFSCVDCMQVFDCRSVQSHTSCVSEKEKYQGHWIEKKKVVQVPLTKLDRPQRPAMNDLSDSGEDDNDEWITSKKTAPNKRNDSPVGKRVRCEDEMGNENKIFKTELDCSSVVKKAPTPTEDEKKAFCSLNSCSNSSSKPCEVKSFAIGLMEEVQSIIENILQSEGVCDSGYMCMKKKDLAKAFVSRYSGRIANHLMPMIDEVISKSANLVAKGNKIAVSKE